MRVLMLTILCLTSVFLPKILNAQISSSLKSNNEWMKFEFSEQKSTLNLVQDKALLNLSLNDKLRPVSIETDNLSYTHSKFQQCYKDVPIEGAIYIMHERNNKVNTANGKLVRDLNLNTVPAINETEALKYALQYIDATLYAWNDPTHEELKAQLENRPNATFYPSGELVIIDPEFGIKADQYHLAYKFDIYAVQPLTRSLVYVDAETGEVLTTIEKIHDCGQSPATDVSTASGTTNYSNEVYFTACVDNGPYTLANSLGGGMQVFDAGNTNSFPQVPVTNSIAYFDNDLTATEVHWATQKTYEYFQNSHNQNSLDGNGMGLYSWVHHKSNYNNAFWNGSWMTYGDGDGVVFSSLTAPDVVGHEMVHGLTEFSASLIYSNESGALNESFSDIFGEVVERYMRGSNDWLMGADFTVLTGKNTLRDMSNPNSATAITQQPDTYLGNYWYSGDGDNGGVHYNSGVQNYWFYLLSEGGWGVNDNNYTYVVNGIGMDKAANIAYRNLTVYLGETSQYTDARTGSIQAAIDLYGEGSNEAIQTEEAWCAVGLCNFNAPCRMTDSLALVALYNSTNGANWTNTWDLNQPMDTWDGIDLNANGCVTCLDLDGDPDCRYSGSGGNNLVGSIPAELGNLSKLKILNLGRNDLSGSIPAELGNLTSLESLLLESNYSLTGSIPSELGNLNNLTHLDLSFNSLSGTIPVELGSLSNLNYLILESNELSGSIPSEIGNLNNLLSFNLNGNNITGSIPSELGNLTNLDRLWLSLNQLTGSIPPELGNLNNLTQLFLSSNQLSGTIPLELTNLSNLTRLTLSYNQLVGTIPPGFGNLSNLDDLGLSDNQLTGIIPSELGNLNLLEFLRLGDNQFSGNIPFELGNLNNLLYLEVPNNQLSGCYDINLTSLCSQLWSIFNTNNYISNGNNFDAPWEDFCSTGAGECPFAACRYNDSLTLVVLYNSTDGPNWTNLWDLNQPMDTWHGVTLNDDGCVEWLHLSNNQLSGSIPPELGNLSALNGLFLDHNQLTGAIPPELGNLSNLDALFLNNNQLTGSIPPEIGNLWLWGLSLSNNQLSGCFDINLQQLCDRVDVANSGSNIMGGNNLNATWEEFCLNGDGICPTSAVYPGDFNNDGIANSVDLLQWGMAEGNTESPRPNASLTWTPQPCPEWQSYINGANTKHSDGDGNGLVDINDIQALINNYGNTHNINPSTFSESPLRFRLEAINYEYIENNKIETTYALYVESSLGTPVTAHGLTSSIDFSNLPVSNVTNSVSFEVANSVLQPQESIANYNETEKVLNFALTRTDKNNRVCDGVLGIIIVISDDLPSGNQYTVSTNKGYLMSANGTLSNVVGSVQIGVVPQIGISNQFFVSLTATYSQCNASGDASVQPSGGILPYSYLWSTGQNAQEINNLPVGAHSVTVTESSGESQTVSFNTEWAFTPVEVTTTSSEICINFDEAPLSEFVQVSLDNGITYENPIVTDYCYDTSAGTYHLWIRRIADECPVDLGEVTKSSGGCSSRTANAKLATINGQFGQFANHKFHNNYIKAEEAYIKHRNEIHSILNSKDEKYAQVSADFKALKDVALSMLYQTFATNKNQPMVNADHLLLVDQFLVSLSKAAESHDLKSKIEHIRKYLHAMKDKEVKTALIDFDRAGLDKSNEMVDNSHQIGEDFTINLINSVGREAYLTYQTNKGGTVDIHVVDIEGRNMQQSLHQTIDEGVYLNKITKQYLSKGIYFVQVNFKSNEGDLVNKVFKLSVIQ